MKVWLLLLFIALPCQAVRNPFVPRLDPCLSPFQGWTLRGIARIADEPPLALVSTPGGWVRLQPGAWPQPGWQVEDITDATVLVRAQNSCAPVSIRGPENGGMHDKGNRSHHRAAGTGAGDGKGES